MIIKKFKLFKEAVIIPDIKNVDIDFPIDSFDNAVKYGELSGFDVVDYDEFYDSINEEDRKTAPPKYAVPFFALFHPIRNKPMFVIPTKKLPSYIAPDDFKEIMDDIVGHEKVHAEQTKRRSNLVINLPDPRETEKYFSNKEEIMAFSWTIANGLFKENDNIDDAIKDLETIRRTQRPHKGIWERIKQTCKDKIIKRYRKYIYQYLQKMYKN